MICQIYFLDIYKNNLTNRLKKILDKSNFKICVFIITFGSDDRL